jgi:hypothetical protein
MGRGNSLELTAVNKSLEKIISNLLKVVKNVSISKGKKSNMAILRSQ